MNIEKISLVNFHNLESNNLDCHYYHKPLYFWRKLGIDKLFKLSSVSSTTSIVKYPLFIVDKSNVKFVELFFSIIGTFLKNFHNNTYFHHHF